jgi:hypothetical protein
MLLRVRISSSSAVIATGQNIASTRRLGADLENAVTYARAEKAPATRRAYATDFGLFQAWCDVKGVPALPPDPGYR